MTTATQTSYSPAERRAIVSREISSALASFTPNMGGKYSGAQVARAKGIGRKRAMEIFDGVAR